MSEAVQANDKRTPKFKMMWPHLFERGDKVGSPKGAQDGDYEVTAFIPKTADISGLKRLVKSAMVAKFGAEPGQPTEPNKKKVPLKFKTPIKDGDAEMRKDKDGNAVPKAEGCWIVRMAAKKIKPAIVDADRSEVLNPEAVYSGRWAKALVDAYVYDNSGSTGVSLGLQAVQLLDHDTPVGGGASVDVNRDFEVEPLAKSSAGGLLD
jgi:hypothetical protein